MKRAYVKCPYCGAPSDAAACHVVHGDQAKQGQYLYVCNRYPKCDAYVGVHAKSLLPLGTLANGDLRYKRILAHRAFEQLREPARWRNGKRTNGFRPNFLFAVTRLISQSFLCICAIS